MADVSVNSVQPSEVGREMVAYLLTVSILGGGEYSSKGYAAHHTGLPIIQGASKDEILRTYAQCLRVVIGPSKVSEILAG